MAGWTPLDDSVKNFREQSHVLKKQGNYPERCLAFFALKKVLMSYSARILTRGLEKLPTSMPGRRILLVPNHRSCLDPAIMHQVLTLSGHGQPRVAALDFIAATPLAPLFRKCGAIFIKGDWKSPEYRAKMNGQFREISDRGDWLEFYLEGQRSISGKQMDPKRGLFTALMEDKPCTIYPINISYARIAEDREFIAKVQGFQLKSTVQSLFLPGKGVGDVYFTVGDPIYTEPKHHPQETSMLVTSAIMKCNVVHGTDLLATILLDRQEHITLSDLQRDMEWLGSALRHRNIYVAEIDTRDTLKLLKHAATLKKGIVRIVDKTLLIYYRNRLMYTISDLVSIPRMLRKEALWTPDRRPRGRDVDRLREIGTRAIEPTVFLYKYLLDRIQEGATSVNELRRSIEDNPHSCYETVTNLITVLKEDKVIAVSGDLIILT
jgi:1-acyl-sn-glycerol-3-phosphate acyltransferase